MKIRNTSPLGDLDVPLLGRVVKAGEVAEVSTTQAERLLPQVDNWQPVDAAAKKVAADLDPKGETR